MLEVSADISWALPPWMLSPAVYSRLASHGHLSLSGETGDRLHLLTYFVTYLKYFFFFFE